MTTMDLDFTVTLSRSGTQRPLPAELLDEVGGVFGDLFGELDHVDASQDNVVGFHWIWT